MAVLLLTLLLLLLEISNHAKNINEKKNIFLCVFFSCTASEKFVSINKNFIPEIQIEFRMLLTTTKNSLKDFHIIFLSLKSIVEDYNFLLMNLGRDLKLANELYFNEFSS